MDLTPIPPDFNGLYINEYLDVVATTDGTVQVFDLCPDAMVALGKTLAKAARQKRRLERRAR